jgi:hypothetical protein
MKTGCADNDLLNEEAELVDASARTISPNMIVIVTANIFLAGAIPSPMYKRRKLTGRPKNQSPIDQSKTPRQ